MSNAHPFWTLPITGGAKLLLTPCPGSKGESLHDSLMQLKDAGGNGCTDSIRVR